MAIQNLPKAQWEILTKQTYEPVRQSQFVQIFVPPVNVQKKTLVVGPGAKQPDQNPNVGPETMKPQFGLFSTLQEQTIPTMTVNVSTNKMAGLPVHYANRVDSLPALTTHHREYQGWYAYRSIQEWNRAQYNMAKQSMGYQYQYKGGVIILNTPTFESDYTSDINSLIDTSSDQNTLLNNLKWDEVWIFVNAFPSNLPGPSFTYNGDEQLTYTVDWTYDRMLTTTDLKEMIKNNADWTKEIPMTSLQTLAVTIAGNIQG